MMHIVLTFILQLDVLDGALKKNPCDDLFSLLYNSLTAVRFHQIGVILKFVDTYMDIVIGTSPTILGFYLYFLGS